MNINVEALEDNKVKISVGQTSDDSETEVSPLRKALPWIILAAAAAGILFGLWYHKKRKYRYRTR